MRGALERCMESQSNFRCDVILLCLLPCRVQSPKSNLGVVQHFQLGVSSGRARLGPSWVSSQCSRQLIQALCKLNIYLPSSGRTSLEPAGAVEPTAEMVGMRLRKSPMLLSEALRLFSANAARCFLAIWQHQLEAANVIQTYVGWSAEVYGTPEQPCLKAQESIC